VYKIMPDTDEIQRNVSQHFNNVGSALKDLWSFLHKSVADLRTEQDNFILKESVKFYEGGYWEVEWGKLKNGQAAIRTQTGLYLLPQNIDTKKEVSEYAHSLFLQNAIGIPKLVEAFPEANYKVSSEQVDAQRAMLKVRELLNDRPFDYNRKFKTEEDAALAVGKYMYAIAKEAGVEVGAEIYFTNENGKAVYQVGRIIPGDELSVDLSASASNTNSRKVTSSVHTHPIKGRKELPKALDGVQHFSYNDIATSVLQGENSAYMLDVRTGDLWRADVSRVQKSWVQSVSEKDNWPKIAKELSFEYIVPTTENPILQTKTQLPIAFYATDWPLREELFHYSAKRGSRVHTWDGQSTVVTIPPGFDRESRPSR